MRLCTAGDVLGKTKAVTGRQNVDRSSSHIPPSAFQSGKSVAFQGCLHPRIPTGVGSSEKQARHFMHAASGFFFCRENPDHTISCTGQVRQCREHYMFPRRCKSRAALNDRPWFTLAQLPSSIGQVSWQSPRQTVWLF